MHRILLQGDVYLQLDLIAVAGRDGDFVAAFGATAAEDGLAGFGLHAGEETVGFGAAAAVWLEGALWHVLLLLRGRAAAPRDL